MLNSRSIVAQLQMGKDLSFIVTRAKLTTK